jgi:hypothetical protein
MVERTLFWLGLNLFSKVANQAVLGYLNLSFDSRIYDLLSGSVGPWKLLVGGRD